MACGGCQRINGVRLTAGVVIRCAESGLLGNRKTQVGDVVDYFLYTLVISPHI